MEADVEVEGRRQRHSLGDDSECKGGWQRGVSREKSPAGDVKDVAVAGRVHAAVEQVCIK